MIQHDLKSGNPRHAGTLAIILIVAIGVRAFWWASPGFAIDQAQFVAWSEISRPGSELNPPGSLSAVYDPRPDASGKRWCNYPPLTIYILRGLAEIYDSLSPTDQSLNASIVYEILSEKTSAATRRAAAVYKAPAILADALMGALLFIFLAQRHPSRRAAAVALAYVLMPAVIHNSTLWGQVDAIPTLLIVISLECARRGRVLWMIAVATLAILTKAQALMMTPLWLAIAVRFALVQEEKPRKDEPRTSVRAARRTQSASGITITQRLPLIGAMLAVAAAIILVVLLPFHAALDGVWDAYAGAASYYPFTHLNGFSAWFLGAQMLEPHLDATPLSAWYVSDASPIVLGLTPRTWGLIGLMIVWVCVGVVLWRRRCDAVTLNQAARLLPLAFFVLSTQMHERYLFPAIAIWAWSYQASRRWCLSWIAIAACASINAFWAWPGPPDAAWTTTVERLVHHTWLGMPPGIWCSVCLITLVALTYLDLLGAPIFLKERVCDREGSAV
ncbi:MAG: hypothetical protein ACE5EQ_08150 [Phycisphaerae bacterium]